MEIKTYHLSGMTCGSCAMRIEKAIGRVAGVQRANVNFAKRQLTVESDPAIDPSVLAQTLAEVGKYRLMEKSSLKAKKPAPAWSWGVGGFLFISVIFFLAQAVGMQSLTAPLDFLLERWYLVLPLSIGFSAQTWLFRSIRLLAGHGGGGTMATSGGVSSGTMFACCLHNLVPLFPILGVSGLSGFVATYQTSVFFGSIAFTYAGVVYMFRTYRIMKRRHSA